MIIQPIYLIVICVCNHIKLKLVGTDADLVGQVNASVLNVMELQLKYFLARKTK